MCRARPSWTRPGWRWPKPTRRGGSGGSRKRIRKVNKAIQAGAESYFRHRQIELLPTVVPVIANALSDATLVAIWGGGTGAPEPATHNITNVIQTVLAVQLVARAGNSTAPRPATAGRASPRPSGAEPSDEITSDARPRGHGAGGLR